MQLCFISKKGDNTTQTGRDPLLKCLYLTNRLRQFTPGLVTDKCLLEQKTPTETKNNCVHVQLEQIIDKIKRDQNPNFWRAGSKCRVYAWPLHSPLLKGWANYLSSPSCPTPGHTPTITPYKEPACPPWASKWPSEPVACCPSKAFREFSVWPLINFYWLRPRTLVHNDMKICPHILLSKERW